MNAGYLTQKKKKIKVTCLSQLFAGILLYFPAVKDS